MYEEINKEMNISNYIHPSTISVSINKTEKILSQIKNSIFEIKYNNKSTTGFFCKIDHGKGTINSLIINYNIIDPKINKDNKTLNLSLNDGKEKKEINLNLQRKIYNIEKLDITIIEIIKEDEIDNSVLLELDDNLYQDFSEKLLYILQYKIEKEASVSYGVNMGGDVNKISIDSDMDICSLGAPILNLTTNKVIGVCKGFVKDKINGMGINFKYVIEELIIKINNANKNEIKIDNESQNEILISIKIDKNDINKK